MTWWLVINRPCPWTRCSMITIRKCLPSQSIWGCGTTCSSSLSRGQTPPIVKSTASSDDETLDFSSLLANIADEDLKEALTLNQIGNISDEFSNVTNAHFPVETAGTSESNVDIDSLTNLTDDTGRRTLFLEMEEFWNFQFEDNLNFQLL